MVIQINIIDAAFENMPAITKVSIRNAILQDHIEFSLAPPIKK